MKKDRAGRAAETGKIISLLFELVSEIPHSEIADAGTPLVRSRKLARKAALNAAAISGTLAIPPGAIGMATILPDLLAIWRIQRQLVADIAGAFEKSAVLSRETMIFCLFKHGGAALTRDLVVRVGERYLIHQATVRALQRILEKIGVRLTQQVIAKSLSRFLPLVGAVGVGSYAYYDTRQVAATAIELFSADVAFEPTANALVLADGSREEPSGGLAAESDPSDTNEQAGSN